MKLSFFNRIPQLGDPGIGDDVYKLQSESNKAMTGNLVRGVLYIIGISSILGGIGISVFQHFHPITK